MKLFAVIGIAIAAATLSHTAQAQFAKAEDAIKYRKNALFVMGQHFGRVNAMATGRVPFDAKNAQENAEIAEMLGKLPWAAFGAGTDKGDTRAKPEIWSEPAKFKEASDRMNADLAKLSAATRTGNLDSIKAAVSAAGGSCKACHDSFRTQ
jgi:cytochrome c556